MQKLLLMGDEAIAQAAIDAGISGIYAYPGTPSTEITEYVQHSAEAKEKAIHSDWSANEKTAMEASLGMSYTGKRTMVCMKHVGLNVAADAFVNSAITGANGGMVIVCADDPSMHSSQNEQDSRELAKFAFMPVLEPANQQEAYDMAYYGFELSEKFRIPVMLRITTRLAHSRAGVQPKEKKAQNEMNLPAGNDFILLPAYARKKYDVLLEAQKDFEIDGESSGMNSYSDGPDKSLGIIACGLAHNYLMENYPDRNVPHPVLKISQYPLPRTLVEKLANECDKLLILEEGYPMVEGMLKGYLPGMERIQGRLDGTLPRTGELNPNLVGKALGKSYPEGMPAPDIIANRPPMLCKGCPHIDTYRAMSDALSQTPNWKSFSDIGCYTLGALPPYNAIHSCVDMGASVTMAKGASDAGLRPAIAVIGDSTFTHSGMTGLLDCVIEQTPVTIIIVDNATTGMTGGQKSHAEGRLEQICKGLGVEEGHIRVLNPLKKHHDEMVAVMKEEFAYEGVSVIIPRRECIQTAVKKSKKKKK